METAKKEGALCLIKAEAMLMKILVLNGPNLNMTGRREPKIYGSKTLDEIIGALKLRAKELGVSIDHIQTNHEGVLIDNIQAAPALYAGIIINPGALTHYSYALRDAIACCPIPVGEVHISNILERELFRTIDVIQEVCAFRVMGLGPEGYETALSMLMQRIPRNPQ